MLDDLFTDSLDATIEAIEIQSTFGPPIFVREPFRKSAAPSAPSVPSSGKSAIPALPGFDVARALKPKVIVHLRNGGTEVFAPYGEPGPSKWPWVTVGLVAGLSFLVYRSFFRKCSR